MTKLISLALIGFLLLSYKENISIDKIELWQIFKDIVATDSARPGYFLIDSIQDFKIKSIDQSGIKYLIASSDIVNSGVWTNEIFDNAKIISRKYLDSVAKPNSQMEPPSHYSFSLPYFSKDKKSFVIYYNYYCGSLCAEYSLRLYKKNKGKWVFIKSFFSIVS